MAFQATLISMVDPLSPIYSELWPLKIQPPEAIAIELFSIAQNISDLEGQP